MSENNQIMSVQGQLVGLPLAGPESFSQQQLDYLKRAMGVDETVLFEDNAGAKDATLSESFANFDRIRIYFRPYTNNPVCEEIFYNSNQNYNNMSFMYGFYEGSQWRGFKCTFNVGMTLLKISSSYYYEGYVGGVDVTNTAKIYKVVGIHRIAGGN